MNTSCSVIRLKAQIQMQTGLEPDYQELFFENLPYQPQEPVPASKLPTTAVRHSQCTHMYVL